MLLVRTRWGWSKQFQGTLDMACFVQLVTGEIIAASCA